MPYYEVAKFTMDDIMLLDVMLCVKYFSMLQDVTLHWKTIPFVVRCYIHYVVRRFATFYNIMLHWKMLCYI